MIRLISLIGLVVNLTRNESNLQLKTKIYIMDYSVVNTGLGNSSFTVRPPLVKREVLLEYRVGQPLGYYSSWALFALSHHIVIWLAADRVYADRRVFRAYAVLGDDVVIGDRGVAEAYYAILQTLGVEISLHKSLISNSGAFEFANRFFIKRGTLDLSPISMRALLLGRSTMGLLTLYQKYSIKKWSVLFRIGGAGYRVLGKLLHHRSNRWQRLWVVLHKPRGDCPLAFEFWLGGGIPLCPYLSGRLRARILNEVKPKDIKLPIGTWYLDGLVTDAEFELLERTTLRSWMEKWFSWLFWYHSVALNPSTRISVLFDYPVVERSWKRTNVNHELSYYHYLIIKWWFRLYLLQILLFQHCYQSIASTGINSLNYPFMPCLEFLRTNHKFFGS